MSLVYVPFTDLKPDGTLSYSADEIFILKHDNVSTSYIQGSNTDEFNNILTGVAVFDITETGFYKVYVERNSIKYFINNIVFLTTDVGFGTSSQERHVLPGMTLKEVVDEITDASSSKIYTVYIHNNTTIGANYIHPNSNIRIKAVHKQVWDSLDFGNADFSVGVRFEEMQFGSANFSNSSVENCWFTNCHFSNPNFQIGNTSKLTSTIFYNCIFEGGNFTGAKLFGTVFNDCKKSQPSVSLNFTNSTNWTYTNWSNSNILHSATLTGSPASSGTAFKAISNIKYNHHTLWSDGISINEPRVFVCTLTTDGNTLNITTIINTTQATFTGSRTVQGVFKLTANTNLFVANKTFFQSVLRASAEEAYIVEVNRTSNTELGINCGQFNPYLESDVLLVDTPFKIEVWF